MAPKECPKNSLLEIIASYADSSPSQQIKIIVFNNNVLTKQHWKNLDEIWQQSSTLTMIHVINPDWGMHPKFRQVFTAFLVSVTKHCEYFILSSWSEVLFSLLGSNKKLEDVRKCFQTAARNQVFQVAEIRYVQTGIDYLNQVQYSAWYRGLLYHGRKILQDPPKNYSRSIQRLSYPTSPLSWLEHDKKQWHKLWIKGASYETIDIRIE